MGAARPFDWKEAVALKHEANKERIPPKWRLAPDYKFPSSVIGVPAACGLLTPEELIMTESEGGTLLENLKEGTWTAVEVMSAFCKRASIAHQAANCLTEVFFERGLALAAEADRRREQGEPLGLLHGLPVSVKDQFPLGGAECNMGWASWIGRKHERSAVIVEALEAAGAIVFCRTNLSQGCWFPEGENLVYGITNNPFGAAFVPGGSSAGEGALNALRGSPLGVGTDIGGSVRIPASFCGIYGLKPTTRRFPYGRALNSLVGQENVESSLGPMSTSLSLCTAFTKAVLSTNPWDLDPSVVPIPWRQEMFDLKRLGGHGAQLSIGVYDFDGAIHILPPQKRAMKMMVAALRKAGHEIVPWKPTAYPEAVELLIQIFEADGGADLQDVVGLTGEPILPQVVVGKREGVTVFDTYLTNRKKTEVRELLLEQWLDTAKRTSTGRPIDCIIGPVAPYTASKHRQSEYFGYTGVYNLLDWPAIAVPVTHCDPDLDVMTPEYDYEPLNEMDARIKASYDPTGAKGLPVGLQIVGRRFQEEELLGMTKVIMGALAASGV